VHDPQGTASFLDSRRSLTIRYYSSPSSKTEPSITLTNVSLEVRCLPQHAPRGCVPAEPHGRFGPVCLEGHLMIVDVQKHWRGSITVLRPKTTCCLLAGPDVGIQPWRFSEYSLMNPCFVCSDLD
jgi:hypothetical protein